MKGALLLFLCLFSVSLSRTAPHSALRTPLLSLRGGDPSSSQTMASAAKKVIKVDIVSDTV